jgi:hypothetical protein
MHAIYLWARAVVVGVEVCSSLELIGKEAAGSFLRKTLCNVAVVTLIHYCRWSH